MLYITFIGVRHTVKRVTLEEPEDILFTEIDAPEGVSGGQLRRGRRGEGDMSAGGAARGGLRARAARWPPACSNGCRRTLTGARCATGPPASNTTRTMTSGCAPRASTCGRTSSTTSAAWCATAPARTSATRCPVKERCTDSDRGREIVRPLDPWPHSEAGRFHRVIALMLVVLAACVVLLEMVRHHRPAEAAALVTLLGVCVLAGRFLVHDLRAHPSNFSTVLSPTVWGDQLAPRCSIRSLSSA